MGRNGRSVVSSREENSVLAGGEDGDAEPGHDVDKNITKALIASEDTTLDYC